MPIVTLSARGEAAGRRRKELFRQHELSEDIEIEIITILTSSFSFIFQRNAPPSGQST